MTSDRRNFMRWSFGGIIGAALGTSASARGLDAQAPGQSPTVEAWLTALEHKKRRAFLDIGAFNADLGQFRRAGALLNAFRDAYKVPEPECGVAFGCHGTALAYMMAPAAWDSLGLVEMIAGSRPSEAAALRAATTNWGTTIGARITELQQRGMRFLACRNTIARWATSIGERRGVPAQQVNDQIVAGLHAGVEPVPAMIATAVIAQERGFGYVTLG
jgi:intracellular sulfur oxidation DsrE/DsrF family protein